VNVGQFNEEQRARLWQFILHEDLLFSERHNLFLVAESMLVVGYVEAPKADTALAISLTGLLLTVGWLYVSGRHAAIIDLVQKDAKVALPDYKVVCEKRAGLRLWRFRSRVIVTFIVPGLFLGLWITLVALLN
jgi:hypothetical protein